MKRRKERTRADHSGSTLVLVFCGSLVCNLLAGCSDRRELSYAEFPDAVKAGEVTPGWLPDYLPKTASSIHLVEEDSPSMEWCNFEFQPTDSEILRQNLKSINALPASMRRVPEPGASWWPAVLTGSLDVEATHRKGFELYAVESPADSTSVWVDIFAIDWQGGRGYFYGRRE